MIFIVLDEMSSRDVNVWLKCSSTQGGMQLGTSGSYSSGLSIPFCSSSLVNAVMITSFYGCLLLTLLI